MSLSCFIVEFMNVQLFLIINDILKLSVVKKFFLLGGHVSNQCLNTEKNQASYLKKIKLTFNVENIAIL